MTSLKLAWDHGEAVLQSLGAMLAPIRFRLPNGRVVQPMHIAPFGEEPGAEALPGVLRGLRGDWPCVPFGMTPTSPLPSDWPQDLKAPPGEAPHGFGANHDWQLDRAPFGRTLIAYIEYPEPSPIASMTRRVMGIRGKPRVATWLTVEPRRDCRLPFGLHPTFRLPERPYAVRIDPGRHTGVWTYPLDVAPTPTLFAANARAESLNAVPTPDGALRDATRVPFPEPCENLLLLSGVRGRCALENVTENYRVTLSWDPDHFPSLMLWQSNRGRAFAPWNSRHTALGIEPVCAPFDFGEDCATRDTPLSQAGVPTHVELFADTLFTTYYEIGVEEIYRLG